MNWKYRRAKFFSNGNWTDYVFTNGKRIVKADSFKDEIALQGNNTAAGQYTWWGITGTPNVAVRTGDKLFFYHLQQGSAEGGMILTFSDGTNTGWPPRTRMAATPMREP